MKELSAYLTQIYGKGFSVGNLKNIRQFYKVNSTDQIGETVFSQFENLLVVGIGRKLFLSWSHYLKLMRIDNLDERHFCKNCQGGKVLEAGKFTFDTANSANVQILEKIEAAMLKNSVEKDFIGNCIFKSRYFPNALFCPNRL